MANINKELNQIKNAVYGKDVRQAIHDAIQQAYNDATSGDGDATLEVKLARGIYDNLNARLNASDAQLARKPTYREVDSNLQQGFTDIQTYLENQLEAIGNMTPRGAVATLQDLERSFPDGTEGIFLVQEDGHWYYWNGSKWADGGVYQAQPWDEFMTEPDEEWVI